MRKTITDVYGINVNGELESEKFFIESIRNGTSEIDPILFGRMNEFSGLMQGWVPYEDDPIFFLQDNSFSKNSIILADDFSKVITGQEAFFEYSFPPRGPGVIAPWIFKFIGEYAIGKGLDKIIEILKDEKSKSIGREISIDWGSDNGDSLGEIEISFKNGHSIVIESYPSNIDRITIKQKKMIQDALKEKKQTKIVYDAWGRVTAYQDDGYGNSIDIHI